MPKKVSKKKTTKRPKKVSRKKSKRVTKRKPKYKRRKRRFGSERFYDGLPNHLDQNSEHHSDMTNSVFQRLVSGLKPKKSVNYKDVLERLRGTKGIQTLYNKAFTKIGKDDPDAILKRHKAFHTVLVAIISAILQLINKVGTVQRRRVFDNQRQDVSYLPVFSRKQTYSESGLQKYVDLPVEQTRITDFNIVERNGVVTGFTHKFRNQLFEVSIFGRQQGSNFFIDSLFTNLSHRLLVVKDSKASESEDGREFLRVASAYDAAFSTVVNIDTGDIASFQVDQLASDLGAMTVNPLNTIVKNVHDVNETLKTFENPSEKELSKRLKKLSLSIDTGEFLENNPFANFDTKKTSDDDAFDTKKTSDNNPFAAFNPKKTSDDDNPFDAFGPPEINTLPEDDGKPKAGPEITYLFGRRKRKRKVSKKKVSKKKVSKKKGPSVALKKLCKRLKVKLTTKRGGKRVYKSEKVLKAQCKKAAKKSSFGKSKKKVSTKKGPSEALKKLCKRLKVKLTVKRGKKRVYKSEKVLKAQCKKAAKKSSFGKKKKRRRKRTSK